MQECGLIATKYGCPNKVNCTDNTLSLLQWGSSSVTQNPLYVLPNDPYTPIKDSVVNWGDYGFIGLDVPLEYNAYSVGPLNFIQTQRVTSNFTDYYGLNNTYDMARLMQAYFNGN
jgi:hypothetical protein